MTEYRLTGTRATSGNGELRGQSLSIPYVGAADSDGADGGAVELLLAAIASDLLAAAHRAALALHFETGDIEVHLTAAPDHASSLCFSYELVVGSGEPESRMAQFHAEVRRLAPVLRTVGAAVRLSGRVRHRQPASAS